MATPSTMRPLAPAPSPSSSTASRTSTAATPSSSSQRTAVRSILPAKLAPANSTQHRPLRPLLAAAAPTTSSKRTILPARSAASLPSASTASPSGPSPSAAARRLPSLAPAPVARSSAAPPVTQQPASVKRAPIAIASKSVPTATRHVEERTGTSSGGQSSSYDSTSPIGGRGNGVLPGTVSPAAFDEEEGEDDDDDDDDDDEDDEEDDVKPTSIRPKKEWVLPARAKPGRKPSEVEPPTKRKAQNRASQRAFRERRQSYVATLEAKVTAYEQRANGIATAELQRVARRLKEENEGLKGANATLRARVQRLEAMLIDPRGEGITTVKKENDGSHSAGGMAVSMLLSDASSTPPRRQSWDWSSSSSTTKAYGSAGLSPSKDVEMNGCSGGSTNRDCGFCTEQSPCVCSGEAVLQFDAGQSAVPPHPEQQPQPRPHPQPKQSPVRAAPSSSVALPIRRLAPALSSSKLWHAGEAGTLAQRRPTATGHMLPPLLHRTSAAAPSPRTSGKLWPVYAASSPIQQRMPQQHQPTVFRMRKQTPGAPQPVCSGDPADCGACQADPALAAFCRAVSDQLAFSGGGAANDLRQRFAPATMSCGPVVLDAGNALPLRRKRARSGSNMTSGIAPTSSATSSVSSAMSLYTNGGITAPPRSATTSRPKLWTVSRSSDWLGRRPALLPSPSSMAAPPLTSPVFTPTVESIPEAWQRIKQHPHFDQWQGGLDMLADVVARRSDDGGAVAAQEDDGEERAVIVPRPASFADTLRRESSSADRGAVVDDDDDDAAAAAAAISSPPRMQLDDVQEESEPTTTAATQRKRRRVYVQRKRVDDVLALMDQATTATTTTIASSPEEKQACACPLSKIM